MNLHELRTSDLHTRLVAACDRVGLTARHVPPVKSLADIALGRYQPNAAVLLLIRYVTDGDVDLEHWVRDLFTDNSQDEKLANADRNPLHASECGPPSVAVGPST